MYVLDAMTFYEEYTFFRGEESPDKPRSRPKHYKKEAEGSDSDSDHRSHSKTKKEKIRSIVSKKKAAQESDSDTSDSWEQERPQSVRTGKLLSPQTAGNRRDQIC